MSDQRSKLTGIHGRTKINPKSDTNKEKDNLMRKILRLATKVKKLAALDGAPQMGFFVLNGGKLFSYGSPSLCQTFFNQGTVEEMVKASLMNRISKTSKNELKAHNTVDLKHIDLQLPFQRLPVKDLRKVFSMLNFKKGAGERQTYTPQNVPPYWPKGVPFTSHSKRKDCGKRVLSTNMLVQTLYSFKEYCEKEIKAGKKPVNIASDKELPGSELQKDEGNETMPDFDLTKEQENYTMPESEFTMETEKETMPESDFTMETEKETMPDFDLTKEQENYTMPESDFTMETEKETMPDFDLTKEQENYTMPDFDLTKEQENYTMPESEFTMENGKAPMTDFDLTAYLPIETTYSRPPLKLTRGKRYNVSGEIMDMADFRSLRPGKWLTDKVMNASFRHLMQRTNSNESKRIYVLPSYMAVLWDLNRFNTWLYKAVIFSSYEWVFMPVNVNENHWVLLAAHPPTGQVNVLDSMDDRVNINLVENWRKFMKIRNTVAKCSQRWRYGFRKSSFQSDGSSCGLYVIMNAVLLMNGGDPQETTLNRPNKMREDLRQLLIAVAAEPSAQRSTCDINDCKKPGGSAKWVCCDVCGRWLHFKCVGIASNPTDDYLCPICYSDYL